MERKAYGRDLSLTIRMAFVSVVLALMYVASTVVVLIFFWSARDDLRAWLIPPFWGLFIWAHFKSAGRLVLSAAGAGIVSAEEAPGLHARVERVCAMADLPKPRIAVVPSDVPNAFATGRTPATSVVAVTTGLVERLDERELESVVAHELAHIANRDAMVLTAASFFQMLGALMLHRSYGAVVKYGDYRSLRERIAFAIIKPFAFPFYVLSTALALAVSRYREYAADRGSALITGAPEQLMSALQKIAGEMARIPKRDLRALSGLNAFFIIPTKSKGLDFELQMDHPPLEKRLEKLAEIAREMGRPVR